MSINKKKITSGGAVLLAKHGKNYFSDLAKKGAQKRKEAMLLWEEAQKLKK